MLLNLTFTAINEKITIISILQIRKLRLKMVRFLAQDEQQSCDSNSALFKAKVRIFYYTTLRGKMKYDDPDLDGRDETQKN